MMPVKEILAMSPAIPRPPVLVIDETTIKETVDAGPVCGCHEKYRAIRNYTPFLPGAVHPYNRRNIPDSNSYDVTWKRLRIGACGYVFDKPIATHRSEFPENHIPKDPADNDDDDDDDDLMFIQLPRFTESYYQNRMRERKREHVEGCDCPRK